MAAAEDDELLPRLPDLFETGQQLLDEVEVAAEPTGSRAVQDKVSKGLDLLKTAAEMLSQLDLFRYGGRAGRAPRVQPPGLGCGAGGGLCDGAAAAAFTARAPLPRPRGVAVPRLCSPGTPPAQPPAWKSVEGGGRCPPRPPRPERGPRCAHPAGLHRLPSAPRSRNEDLEEIASTDLKYLMLPAFQGALAMKQVNPSKRLDHLQQAREHFSNYLTQCQHYHVAEFQLPKAKDNSAENNTASSSVAYPNLFAMAAQRQAKIERWVGSCHFKTVR